MCYLARQLSTHSLSAANLYPVACSASMEMSPLRFPFARLNNVRAPSVGGKEEGFSFLAPLPLPSVRTATGPSCSQQPPVFPATTSGSFMWRDSSKVAPYKWFSLARRRVSLQHVLEGASSATPVPSIPCVMATSSACNILLQCHSGGGGDSCLEIDLSPKIVVLLIAAIITIF